MTERNYEDCNEALDPELLYTKEYCIGLGPIVLMHEGGLLTLSTQEAVALAKSSRGTLFFREIQVARID